MTEQTSAVTCKYPGCEAIPERTAGPGRPAEYCPDPAHNKVSAWRERRRLADAERGVATTDAEVEQPVTMARITGAEMLRQMRDLAGTLTGVADRLTRTATTLGDPTAAEAEVESARAAAERRAATAEAERADAERRAATAEQMRTSADEAAEEMSEHLASEQARAHDAHDRLAAAIEAHTAELERVGADAQARVEAAIADRDAAIAKGEAEKAAAIKAADEQCTRAESEARTEIERTLADTADLVRGAEELRDQAIAEAQQHREVAAQTAQRAAAAEARAERADAETARVREAAAHDLERARSEAERFLVWAITNTSSLDGTPALSLSNAELDVGRYVLPPRAEQKSGNQPLRQCLNQDPCSLIRDHPTVMEVLAAFIREHSGRPAGQRTHPDVQAALRVIGRRDSTRDRDSPDLLSAQRTQSSGVMLRHRDLGPSSLVSAFTITNRQMRTQTARGCERR